MKNSEANWICCQLGAREHYAVPRALHNAGSLVELVTDLWIPPAIPVSRHFPQKLRERFHPELSDATVKAVNLSALFFEGRSALSQLKGWDLIVRRNNWFQERALHELTRLAEENPHRQFRLFSFSYTAHRLFKFAKLKGWATVLGQIDPGPLGERIVARLQRQYPELAGSSQPAPISYWQRWREECRLADRVIVNSGWSRLALLEEDVADDKIRITPLAYEAPVNAASFRRRYPDVFTPERPLRVLFLGQVNLGKGMAAILDGVRLLENEPIEFWIVGQRQMKVPVQYLKNKHLRWLGAVPRSEAARYYQEADVFLFPTFSDGFGLTQLEAQAWKLPVIASRFCGNVVRDGVNGALLTVVSGEAIAEVIGSLITNPGRLDYMSRNSVMPADFGIVKLSSDLLQAVAS